MAAPHTQCSSATHRHRFPHSPHPSCLPSCPAFHPAPQSGDQCRMPVNALRCPYCPHHVQVLPAAVGCLLNSPLCPAFPARGPIMCCKWWRCCAATLTPPCLLVHCLSATPQNSHDAYYETTTQYRIVCHADHGSTTATCTATCTAEGVQPHEANRTCRVPNLQSENRLSSGPAKM